MFKENKLNIGHAFRKKAPMGGNGMLNNGGANVFQTPFGAPNPSQRSFNNMNGLGSSGAHGGFHNNHHHQHQQNTQQSYYQQQHNNNYHQNYSQLDSQQIYQQPQQHHHHHQQHHYNHAAPAGINSAAAGMNGMNM